MKSLKAKAIKVAKVALLGGLVIGGCGCVSNSVMNQKISDAVTQAKTDMTNSMNTQIDTLKQEKIDLCGEVGGEWNTNTTKCDMPIDSSENIDIGMAEFKNFVTCTNSETYEYGYEISGTEALKQKYKQLSCMFNGEVEVNKEDYKYTEWLEIDGAKLNTREGVPIFETFETDAFKNYIEFNSKIPILEIDNDNPLEITLANKNIKVTSIDASSLTYKDADTITVKKGNTYVLGDKNILIENVGEDGIIVSVNGERDIIEKGHSDIVNDVEIECISVVDDYAETVIGIDLAKTINHGSAFEVIEEVESGDPIVWKWFWSIDTDELHKIGFESNKKFDDDSDGDFPALTVGNSIVAPNDAFKITLDSLDDIDVLNYEVEVDDGYYVFTGSVEVNGEDYNEILLNTTDILDVNENIIGTEAKLEDSGITLVPGASLVFGDIEVIGNLGTNLFTALTVDGTNITTKDYDIMNLRGDLVYDVENNYNDGEGSINLGIRDSSDLPEATLKFEVKRPEL